MQASVLNLYDPGRSHAPMRKVNGEDQESDWAAATAALQGIKGASKVSVLAAPSSSLPPMRCARSSSAPSRKVHGTSGHR